nr:reverse transcriptase domain-containing protein [Tanacetum cinerariifolium]
MHNGLLRSQTLRVTQSIKVNGVTDDALRLYLFPHSLTHHATAWFDRLPRNSINTFEQMAKMFLRKYFPPSMVTKLRNGITNFRQRGTFMKRRLEECYDLIENMTDYHNDWDTSTQRTTIGQTQNVYAAGAYQGGNSYQPQGPMIPTTSSSSPKVVERKTEVTKDTVPPTNNGSTKDVQPPVVQIKTPIPNSKPIVALVAEPVVAFVSALKPNQKPPVRSRRKQKSHAIIRVEQDFLPRTYSHFDDSRICGPVNFSTNRCRRRCLRKSAKVPFLGDFVVVDFDADPRVPLILKRSFLKTERALFDVYAGELTLRVNNEAVTFNLDQTSRYTANYNDMTANQNDVIDMACEEYSQEVLSFSDVIASGNPTPFYDPIVSTSSSTLTPFEDSDFLLEEVDAFLALEDDSTSPKVDHSYYDTEGDILLLEAFLKYDPSLPPPTQGIYLP